AIISGILHPDSLLTDRVRVVIQYKVVGPNPELEFSFENGPSKTIADAVPVKPVEPDWMQLSVTAIRANGGSFGLGVDMFVYENRDIEVRTLYFEDIGPIGDANLDGIVDVNDLQTVIDNLGSPDAVENEEGDVNDDDTVDAIDAQNVIQGMTSGG
ncbi:MAG: hypothetical protein AAGA55_00235, partial [Planctomycetota bacterium]